MSADLLSSDHSGEDVHEHSDIDETSLESDVRDIAHPDLILSRDLKILNKIVDLQRISWFDRSVSPRPRDALLSSIGEHVYTRQCIPYAVAAL